MSKLLITFVMIIGLAVTSTSSVIANRAIDISGVWQFALDRDDRGLEDNWFNQSFKETIKLPGVLQSQGYGDEISTSTPWVLSLYDKNWFLREDYRQFAKPGNTKVPFLSQPPRHYLGAAWYVREFVIPDDWQGKRISLYLERPRWESSVWIDGRRIGSDRSLVAAHEYELGDLAPGKHRIAIRVDNRMLMDYRPDAHSVSDSLGQSWNGIVGKMELKATSKVWIDDAQVFTNLAAKSARVALRFGNASALKGSGMVTANGREFPVSWDQSGGQAEFVIDLPNATEWNEFRPVLQKLQIKLRGENADDTLEVTFGFSEIKAEKSEFRLNGRTIYLRGTHHGGDFPLTGYPPTDVAYWRKIFQINKDWGINHIRFHSFCPPEAAFQAADELGIYLQPEPGMWNVVSPGTPMEKMLYDETERMIRAYGNHPSFIMLSPSNEPKGRWKESFDKWIAHYRNRDPRRIYTNGTGHTEREVPDLHVGTDFLVMQRIGQKMLRGNTAWFGKDYGASLEGIDVPVASHELGQWVAYPDFDVMKKFTGYMRPGNYDVFRESARKNGVLVKNKEFALASGRYQLACYKEEIEANLRTPKMYGFQLLDLHDYLGQGTALVGILDAFWEEKGYATAREFKRFNNETVPLARLMKRVFHAAEKFETDVEIAHFGEFPVENAVPVWKIVDEKGRVIRSGEFAPRTIGIGKNIPLGKISVDLTETLPAFYGNSGNASDSSLGYNFRTGAFAAKLVVGIKNTSVENDWNFWIYPSAVPETAPADIAVVHDWPEAETRLARGEKVLFMPRKIDLGWNSPPLDTVPVFWNRLMNPGWGRMLGLWIDKKHPALRDFPTDSFSDWQWMEIVRGARAANLDSLPAGLQPIVQPIDDWNRNYKLGMLFEAKVGRGKLMFSTADLVNGLDSRRVARQLRFSILKYMSGASFDPKANVSPAAMRSIFFDTRVMSKLGAKISGSGDAANAIDGDPNTFWLAGNPRDAARLAHELKIEFRSNVEFTGIKLMPRQNHRDHEGDIREYEIFVSNDGERWQSARAGTLVSKFDPQMIDFGRKISARFIRFVARSGFGDDKTAALAEFAVNYAGPPLPPGEDIEYKRVRSASTDVDESVNADDKKPKPTPKP